MTLSTESSIDVLTRNIQNHHKALNMCPDDFPYRSDMLSSLAEAYAQYGHQLYKDTQYAHALKSYLQARKWDPDHIPALHQIGMCLVKQQAYEQARLFFQESADRAHRLADKLDALLSIAKTFEDEKHWQKAYKTLQEAKQLAPHDARVLAEDQKIRDLVSLNAYTTSEQAFFNGNTSEHTLSSQDTVSLGSFLDP